MTFYTRGGTNVKVKVRSGAPPGNSATWLQAFWLLLPASVRPVYLGRPPRHDSRRAKPRGGEHCGCELGEEIPAFQAGQSRAHRACWRSDSVTRALGPSLCLLQYSRFLSGGIGGRAPQIADEERDTLIKAEISLITNLNSLQGRKKIPVLMRRELPRKHLVWRLFLLPLTRCGASNR
jgi:hypothetical protein